MAEHNSWAQRVEHETKNELWRLQRDRESDRSKAIYVFKHRLLDNYSQLYDAGLLKPGDSLMQIVCRAFGLPFRKQKRKSRNGKN